MNILCNIDYQTVFGEDLIVNLIKRNELGEDNISQYRMCTVDGSHWTCVLNINPDSHVNAVCYYYSISRGGMEQRREWVEQPHKLEITSTSVSNYTVFDKWIDIPEDSYLYSSAFTECIIRRRHRPIAKNDFSRCVRLKVRAPQLRQNEYLYVVGSDEALGEWNVDKALPMYEHETNEWIVDIDVSKLRSASFEFKFVAINIDDDNASLWEDSMNRTVTLPKINDGEVVVYDLSQAFFSIYNTKCAGTLVPVFSLRSSRSFGVGDFGDLKRMVDWIAKMHQRVLQILPVNDTTITHTWTDSYPYSCISIFALHPQYVDINQLPKISDKATQDKFESLRKELNALDAVDYERVNAAKIEYLRIIFKQEGKKMMSTEQYRKFFADTQQWLVPYAQYCFLCDKNGTANFSRWPDHKTWNEADRPILSHSRNKAYADVAFYYFVQYVLNTQMEAVHDYARSLGIVLKGDIPIGVNRYGCDVWQEPKYFNLNGQAGAPPDDFSVKGQNWGFPTYNWDAMLEDGCAWWVRRFANMAKYFDAYRIDHVLGFFRIWEIPVDAVHGLLGQFQPSLGMTRDEIEAYGLRWQEELFTQPFIKDWVLDRIFKEYADEVREKYVEPKQDGFYRMRPQYDTQRKVEAAFEGHDTDKDIWIRDGLYALISDVLFVRDHKDAERFHPRISVQLDFIYESLFDSDKYTFNKLYNDYYYRRNNQFWYREAMKKLPKLVQATRMLVCAEDLGMVPECVSWVMNELRILSLELQSMPKDPKVRFGHLSANPYRSVCTISSHDMPTLRQWWDENEERTQDYYNSMLYRGGAAPHPLPGWLAADIISRHLTSPSMLCIISIQDWMSIDDNLRLADENAERINIPSNPKHYWRYRMHLSIEDLMKADSFNNKMTELIDQSGRK
jgi:4-alpha-glucanotransferase